MPKLKDLMKKAVKTVATPMGVGGPGIPGGLTPRKGSGTAKGISITAKLGNPAMPVRSMIPARGMR